MVRLLRGDILALRVLIRLAKFRYRALANWDGVLTSPESEYWFQLTPGVVIGNVKRMNGVVTYVLISCFPSD